MAGRPKWMLRETDVVLAVALLIAGSKVRLNKPVEEAMA